MAAVYASLVVSKRGGYLISGEPGEVIVGQTWEIHCEPDTGSVTPGLSSKIWLACQPFGVLRGSERNHGSNSPMPVDTLDQQVTTTIGNRFMHVHTYMSFYMYRHIHRF